MTTIQQETQPLAPHPLCTQFLHTLCTNHALKLTNTDLTTPDNSTYEPTRCIWPMSATWHYLAAQSVKKLCTTVDAVQAAALPTPCLKQESPADAVKPARRKSMPKLLQFDVFRFISPNSISPNCQFIASRGRPMLSQALSLYSCTQFEIRCLPIIKFLVQIAST